ncbi:hypothetical protein DPMN_143571 [Dreissena polymorpha]|uniref:Uncharacterized protein n=1 Tax=Dreissena polymorpha TaxID=45954 RepID=A0A9D4GDU2_DREPO|nr:hypothetical protein DPMN_143571 [Dreissena polymorpha]
MDEGLMEVIKNAKETPAVQYFSTDSTGTSSVRASVRDVCFIPSCLTFSFR